MRSWDITPYKELKAEQHACNGKVKGTAASCEIASSERIGVIKQQIRDWKPEFLPILLAQTLNRKLAGSVKIFCKDVIMEMKLFNISLHCIVFLFLNLVSTLQSFFFILFYF